MKTQVTNQHNFTLGELGSIDKFDRTKTYLKVIMKEKNQFGVQYNLGLNTDSMPVKFSPMFGLHFTNLEHLPYFCDYGDTVVEIQVLEDSKIIFDDNQNNMDNTMYITDKFNIIKLWDMNDFLEHVGFITIGGDSYFSLLKTARGLEKLESIGGDAYFKKLIISKGLERLKNVDDSLFFNELISSEGLVNLTSIGECVNFNSLKSSKGLENLKTIGIDAGFYSLISAEGLISLEEIGRYAHFFGLENSDGLSSLKKVGRWDPYNKLNAEEIEKIPMYSKKGNVGHVGH